MVGILAISRKGGDLALARIVNIRAVVIEGREAADGAAEHRHRVGVASEAAIEEMQLLVHHRVVGHGLLEARLLGRRRQLAVEQQVADLEIVAVLGQVLDSIAPVQQDTLVAVDEGQLRFAASRRGEARIVGEQPGIGVEAPDVDRVRAFGARQNGEIPRSSGAVIGHGDRVFRAGSVSLGRSA